MKKQFILSTCKSAILTLVIAQPSFATPINITDGYWGGENHGQGIAYGNLFLNDSWNLNDDAPHYANDNYSTDTVWSYVFSLNDRWSNTGGNGK